MCCDTVWIQKCHRIVQPYYIILNSADQNSLNWLGQQHGNFGELTQIKYEVLRSTHYKIPTPTTVPFTSVGKKELLQSPRRGGGLEH